MTPARRGRPESTGRAFEDVRLEPGHDRLFSVRGLVDPGLRSFDTLERLEERRLHDTVLGNHETMVLKTLLTPSGACSSAGWPGSSVPCGSGGSRPYRVTRLAGGTKAAFVAKPPAHRAHEAALRAPARAGGAKPRQSGACGTASQPEAGTQQAPRLAERLEGQATRAVARADWARERHEALASRRTKG